jgi:hypothetical protein
MMNQTNRVSNSFAAVAAKVILFTSGFALLAGCVEEPPPRPYHAYRQPPPPPPPSTEVYAYPLQNQTAEQQDRDRYDCHDWAVKQTNFDPSAPGTPPHDQVRVVSGPPPGTNTAIGAVTGAILGAVIAGPRNAGGGAVVGAIAGGAVGSSGDAVNASNAQAQAQAARSQDARLAASMEAKATNYRRAVSACLDARGYSVK